MNTILGYSALTGIVCAIVFTSLFQKHLSHVAGLAVIAMALVCGINGQFEVAFRWFCIGTIVTGAAGCLERYQKKHS
jgi:hypothetical protein